MFGDEEKPEPEVEGQNLGAAGDEPATDPAASTDLGEPEAPEQTEAQKRLAQLETERPLYLKSLEDKKRLEDELARERQARIDAEARSAPTKPSPTANRVENRLRELTKIVEAGGDGSDDAAVVLDGYEKAERAEREAQLAEYPAEDRALMRKIIAGRKNTDVATSALILDGLKRRYEQQMAAEKNGETERTNGAIKAEGAKRAAEAAKKPKPVSTSVRPVGASEVAAITKMTFDEFGEAMDRLSPTSKEAQDLNRRTEPSYRGKDKIELTER